MMYTQLQQKLLDLVQEKKSRHVFVYYEKPGEVAVSPLFQKLLSLKIEVYVPVFVDSWGITKLKTLEFIEGKYRVRMPKQFLKVFKTLNEIGFESNDIAIVPGKKFEKYGHRIGHGLGIYDRYLEDSLCFKIGVCFEKQITKNLAQKPHDVKMDLVISV